MSRSLRAGLIVLGVLSVLDLLTPLVTDGEHPPMAIALGSAVIGLASLVLAVSAWRGAMRAVLPLVVLRALSAISAVPAVFAWLQRLGEIDTDEMDRVFNMGIGMAMVVSPYYADSIRHQLADLGIESWTIGKIVAGERGAVWG